MKMPTFKEKFDALIQETLENGASKAEVKQVLDTFIEMFRTLTDTVNKKIDVNNGDMKAETERLGKQVAEFEARIRGVVDEAGKLTDKKMEVLRTDLSTMIGYVESLIEKYDDTEIRAQLDAMGEYMKSLELKIPASFDATEIVEDIEKLEKKVEELEKRPVGGRGGGVSDKAVQFALMRSIQAVTPSGAIDGVNTDFEVPSTIHAVLSFELGSRVVALGEYSIIGGARKMIRFDNPVPASYSGKSFVITYL